MDRPYRTLLQRVHSCIVGEPECGHMQARATIREVAAWMREQERRGLVDLPEALEQEAGPTLSQEDYDRGRIQQFHQ
jgi:hypothetical protein